MAFPVVAGTNSSGQATGTTSHGIALPAGVVAGDLLITYLCAQGISNLTFPAGWTLLNIGRFGGFDAVFIHYRTAVGGETSVSVSWTGTQAVSTNSYRISGAADPATRAPEAAHANDSLNCPSLAPTGGSKDYLWLCGNGNSGKTVSPPSPYTNQVNFGSPSMTMSTARRFLTAATEDPGVWSIESGFVQFTSSTLAIHPLADPTIALTGTVTDDLESDIKAGGSTIILTVTGDDWVADGATFNTQRQSIIDGLASDGAEAGGWDVTVIAALEVTDVVRTSDTVVTITLPAVPSYKITADETITATVPSTALVRGIAVVASPTFTVTDEDLAEPFGGPATIQKKLLLL